MNIHMYAGGYWIYCILQGITSIIATRMMLCVFSPWYQLSSRMYYQIQASDVTYSKVSPFRPNCSLPPKLIYVNLPTFRMPNLPSFIQRSDMTRKQRFAQLLVHVIVCLAQPNTASCSGLHPTQRNSMLLRGAATTQDQNKLIGTLGEISSWAPGSL